MLNRNSSIKKMLPEAQGTRLNTQKDRIDDKRANHVPPPARSHQEVLYHEDVARLVAQVYRS